MAEAQENSKELDITFFAKLEEECGDNRNELVWRSVLYYASLGWPIVPIEYGAKRLISHATLDKRGLKGKIDYSDATTNRDKLAAWYHPETGLFKGFNVGLACGLSVSAIDLDVKNDKGVNGWNEYVQRFGDPGRVPKARTPSGGVHLIVKAVPELGSSTNVLPGIDTRGRNLQTGGSAGHILVYPSVIEKKSGGANTLGRYVWSSGGEVPEPDGVFMAYIARKVTDIGKKGRGNEEVEEADVSDVTIDEVESCLDCIPADDYDTWIKVGMAIHSMWPDSDGYDLWHQWSTKSDAYKGERDCTTHWSSFSMNPNGIQINTVYYFARENGWKRPGEIGNQLKIQLRYNDKGGLKRDLHNLKVILRSEDFAEHYGGPLMYDEFTTKLTAGDHIVHNHWYARIAGWVSTVFSLEYTPNIVQSFVIEAAMENRKDSLIEYIEELAPWDGTDRLTPLSETLNAQSDFERAAIRRWLIGGIARALNPGCTSTHMLILFGAQGIGKSRFFRSLSPEASWFSDSTNFKLSNHSSARDEEIKLQGKWIIEVAELAGIWRSDFTDLKTFLSKQFDTVRKPYSPDPVDMPRRVLFGGSTNTDQVLADETGSRRFVFIRCKEIDVEWVTQNRDQIWAQALALYKSGEEWWFDQEEAAAQAESNKAFNRTDPWEEVILDWAMDKTRFSHEDVLSYVIEMPRKDWTQVDMKRIKAILETNGFKKAMVRIDGKRERLYLGPTDTVDSARWLPNNEVQEY